MAKKTYAEKKAEAQAMAIEWQHNFAEQDYTQFELGCYHNMFYQLGKRYGLLKEFKENGII